jgi:LacI family transcriptional regulator
MTIEQIAVLAGVSRSTVSRVVNEHPRVSPAVRSRVQTLIEEQGYSPHAGARSLVGCRTNVICLLNVRTSKAVFSGQYFPPLIEGLSEACNERGYFLLVSMVKPDLATTFYRRLVRGSHCDGMIVLASDAGDALLAALQADATPSVMIGRHSRFPQLHSVDVANFEGAQLAVDHLVQLGHQRIATITGRLDTTHGADRYHGYQHALTRAGIPLRPDLVAHADLSGHSGYLAMKQLLLLPDRPSAVFAADDAMAAGAIRAIREVGLHVPHDVALVGFDDAPVATLTDPPLTTIRQPIAELGQAAASLIIRQLLDGPTEPVAQTLPVELIIRQSSGPAPL